MRRHASAPRSDVSKNLKMSLALVFAALIAVLVAANASGGDDGPEVVAEDGGAQVVRPDRQRLSTSDSDVTFVGLWDFEIGRTQVGTPVTNAQLVCRLLLENKKEKKQ